MLNSKEKNVRWDTHLSYFGRIFPQMLTGQKFVDLTLACEGRRIPCHRMVLAACSPYFADLLEENPYHQHIYQHSILILPKDVKFWMIDALIQYMYKGEVSVSENCFEDLLKCAELLQIRGFSRNMTQIGTNQRVQQILSDAESVRNDFQASSPAALAVNIDADKVTAVATKDPIRAIKRKLLPSSSDSTSTRITKEKPSTSRSNNQDQNKSSTAASNTVPTLRPRESKSKSIRNDDDSYIDSSSTETAEEDNNSVYSGKSKRKRTTRQSNGPTEDFPKSLPKKIYYDPPEDFILAGPTGPSRNWDARDMWSALMRVTQGCSIKSTAKLYKIPMATLHAYISRYGIKTATEDPLKLN